MKTQLLGLALISSSCLALAQETTSSPLSSIYVAPAEISVLPPVAAPETSAPVTALGATSTSLPFGEAPLAPFFQRLAGFMEVGYTAAGAQMSSWGFYGGIGVDVTPFFFFGILLGAQKHQADRVGWLMPVGIVLRGRWPLSRQVKLWVDGRPVFPISGRTSLSAGFSGAALVGLEIGYFTVGLGVSSYTVTDNDAIPLEQRHGLDDGERISGTGLTLRLGFHL